MEDMETINFQTYYRKPGNGLESTPLRGPSKSIPRSSFNLRPRLGIQRQRNSGFKQFIRLHLRVNLTMLNSPEDAANSRSEKLNTSLFMTGLFPKIKHLVIISHECYYYNFNRCDGESCFRFLIF